MISSLKPNPEPVIARQFGKIVQGPGGELTILERLDLSGGASEAVAVLGASGSGKYTLLGRSKR